MFAIYGGKQEFAQWDLDQLVTNPCMKEGNEVVFKSRGKTYETTAFVMNGEVVADVPNFLLQEPCSITVDLGWGLDVRMECRTVFNVVEREKPVDYCCEYNIKNRENNSGGVSSWNDLTDKPFGEDEIVDAVLAYGDYESALNSTYGAFAISVPWRKTLLANENATPCTVIFDGAAYEISGTVEVPNLGELFGNLALLNAIVGTSFPDTGEPFLGSAGKMYCDLFVMDTEPTSHSVKITAPRKVTKPVPMEYMPSNTYTLFISRDKLKQEDHNHYNAKYSLTMDYDTTELVDTILRGGTVYLSFYGLGYPGCRVVPNIRTWGYGTSLANTIIFGLEHEGHSKQCFRLEFDAVYNNSFYDITLNPFGNIE